MPEIPPTKEVLIQGGKKIEPQYLDKNKYVLAAGDNTGKINLYKWPVAYCTPTSAQNCYSYEAHTPFVARVQFTKNDSHLISTGGTDQCVFQWKTKFEKDENGFLKYDEKIDLAKIKLKSKEKKNKKLEKPPKEPGEIYDYAEIDTGDEFGACKPWMGAIKEPTGYKP